jgi:hypothetical protein
VIRSTFPFRTLVVATSFIVVACGGAGSSTIDQTANCTGSAPFCYGSDLQSCCGGDPAGNATCQGGQWTCGRAGAPGCNGTSCTSVTDDCIGTAPLCFGSDTTSCCGQDSAGSASCEGGRWTCGGTAAPGCNGTSCPNSTGGSFACGPMKMCPASTYCIVTPEGIYDPEAGPNSEVGYSCSPIPSSCAATPSCACIEKTPNACDELPVGSCTIAGGNVTLQCIGE